MPYNICGKQGQTCFHHWLFTASFLVAADLWVAFGVNLMVKLDSLVVNDVVTVVLLEVIVVHKQQSQYKVYIAPIWDYPEIFIYYGIVAE